MRLTVAVAMVGGWAELAEAGATEVEECCLCCEVGVSGFSRFEKPTEDVEDCM